MADESGEHVHSWDDGRGCREVIIDGKLATHVIWCDTKAGVAVVADQPLKASDGETIDVHPVWGEIRVIYCGGYTRGKQVFRFGEAPII
ncbi:MULTISPECIES: hypothetical protein [unclassified Pseudomonas]|uniref:hypothetical protein n=1 Tax=unclassified Pseudomonas TaxID=196821 RepID=UPI000A2007D7|nr:MULTISPECIES: hypothetical protein [unclassified Pseudomonas]